MSVRVSVCLSMDLWVVRFRWAGLSSICCGENFVYKTLCSPPPIKRLMSIARCMEFPWHVVGKRMSEWMDGWMDGWTQTDGHMRSNTHLNRHLVPHNSTIGST